MKSLAQSRKNAMTLAAACLASLMFSLEISSVPVILPILEAVLHGDFRDLQWTMSAYTIGCTTVLMAAGTLADRYGRRRVLLICFLFFGITSLLCGLATSPKLLIVSRFAQGLAGGAMLVCQLAVLSNQFPSGMDRARAFGIWGIVFGIGLGFGPIIGAGIVSLWRWEWVFLTHVPLAIIGIALTMIGVQESRDSRNRKLDLLGIASMSVAIFSLTWLITQGPTEGLTSFTCLTGLVTAVASCMVFFAAEWRAADPIFDFSMFRIRRFSGALLGSAGMNFSFWPFIIYLPMYFQNGLGYGGVATGLALLPYTLPTLVLPPLAERLSLRYQPETVIPAGLFIVGLGFFLMAWASGGASASWLTMLPGCLLAGIGLGMTNTPVTNTTTGSVPAERAGMASGIDMSARLISLAMNIALMGFILVSGIFAYLCDRLPASSDVTQLRSLAEGISAGVRDISTSTGIALAVPGGMATAALKHGFGWVLLYGGVSAWLLALSSMFVLRSMSAIRCPYASRRGCA